MNPVEEHDQHNKRDQQQLNNEEIQRYSRQLILPQFGMACQQLLKSAKVLIIGLGGLGTPAAMYLAGAGVGTLALVDRVGDVVESSNLHRQIAYTTNDVNESKITSLTQAIRSRNPHVNIIQPAANTDSKGFDNNNAIAICDAGYDLVLDCTDNIRARYVVGDACAATNTKLVSAAAIGLSGQLSVHVEGKGCYRCVFPSAPPPNCVGSCDASGVLGPVPGIIGTYMALEAIKIISNFQNSEPFVGRLLIFDAASATMPFRSVKLKGISKPDCIACGPPDIRLDVTTYDYDAFLNGNQKQQQQQLKEKENNEVDVKFRMSVTDLSNLRKSKAHKQLSSQISSSSPPSTTPATYYTLIDVRPSTEFAICHLEESVNVPLQEVKDDARSLVEKINSISDSTQTILICRRGNASRKALKALQEVGAKNIKDVIGGLQQWHDDVDNTFPMY